MRPRHASRLDRLYAESGEYFEQLTADGGHSGGATAVELAKAMIDAQCPMEEDDLAYVMAVASEDREDNEPA